MTRAGDGHPVRRRADRPARRQVPGAIAEDVDPEEMAQSAPSSRRHAQTARAGGPRRPAATAQHTTRSAQLDRAARVVPGPHGRRTRSASPAAPRCARPAAATSAKAAAPPAAAAEAGRRQEVSGIAPGTHMTARTPEQTPGRRMPLRGTRRPYSPGRAIVEDAETRTTLAFAYRQRVEAEPPATCGPGDAMPQGNQSRHPLATTGTEGDHAFHAPADENAEVRGTRTITKSKCSVRGQGWAGDQRGQPDLPP